MPLSVLGIGTAVPRYRLDQQEVLARLSEGMREEPGAARWARRVFAQCGVTTRYTCVPDLLEPADRCRYVSAAPRADTPATSERMAAYRRESVPLAAEASRKALADSRTRPGEITHLIAASCTGLFLPGLDAELAWQLDLPPAVRRIPLTFTGCAAGLMAIRLASEIARSDPDAKVLVSAIELCTLHIQPSYAKEDLYSAAFFGDGASACVVGTADTGRPRTFELREAGAVLLPGTADKMIWTLGDYGFNLFLSPQIPQLIAERVPSAFRTFWGETAMPALWAIHPGGKGIVDALQSSFRLTDSQTEASRSVLRDCGNMSSATILFVLDELRRRNGRSGEGPKDGIALAFGPGITAELLRFVYCP